jgi:HEAT repeat protein
MSRSQLVWWTIGILLVFVGHEASGVALAPRDRSVDAPLQSVDEQILREARIGTDGPALVDFFKMRGKDEKLESTVAGAAVRLLAVKKPAGAVRALLGILPLKDNDLLVEEMETTLTALAFRDAKPDQALLEALDDAAHERRMMAANALCRAGGLSMAATVKKLLKDSDLMVRLRVALRLADLGEEEAVTVLTAMLTELPKDQAWQAEEGLRRLAGTRSPEVAPGEDDAGWRRCRAAWEKWWKANDGPTLLAEFRKWTPRELDQRKLRLLVGQLADDDFRIREKAMATLIEAGAAVRTLLLQAAKEADAEVVYRANKCLKEIDKGAAYAQPVAIARLLGLRKPPGAVEALLDYLPVAEEQGIEEIQDALTLLALREEQPASALLKALDDKSPSRRAAAAVALSRGGGTVGTSQARRLLQDVDVNVRLRTALAMADARDREAIPVLISLLTELSQERVWLVEETLRYVARGTGPAATLGSKGQSRAEYQAVWNAWWREYGPRLDVARREALPRALGFTLIAQFTEGRNGRVIEIGPQGTTRWQLENTPWPLDIQLLAGDRLLLAEYYDLRVAERTLNGKLVWERTTLQAPLGVQRLANGNTFIVTAGQLLEIDRSGKEVFNHVRSGILAAKKLRDGRIACIASPERFILLDVSGKELSSFRVGNFQKFCGFDFTPNGRVVVPLTTENQVVEFGLDDKDVWKASWKATVERPCCAERLANGHTLVACRDGNQVVELDRLGNVIWKHQCQGYPWRAHRR